jgi:hypothetical protein
MALGQTGVDRTRRLPKRAPTQNRRPPCRRPRAGRPGPRRTGAPNRVFNRLVGRDVRLGWDHPHWARLPPQRFPNLPHLRGPTHHPSQGLNPGGRCRDSCWRPRLKRGLARRPMVVQSAAGPTRREGFELLEAPGHLGVEVALAARVREATQSQDVAIGDRLTAQVDGFHAHVHPRVRRLKPPIAPCLNVRLAKADLEHRREPPVNLIRNLTRPTRSQSSQRVSTKPVGSIVVFATLPPW